MTHTARRFRNLCMSSLAAALLAGCGSESDPERTAARWVLDTGGAVVVESDGTEQSIDDPARLPPGSLVVRKAGWTTYPGDRNPAITDDVLARLDEFSALEQLDLSGTAVTDTGLAHVAGLRGLVLLHLNDTAVTDAGLDQLHALEALTELSVVDTQVTRAGVQRLQQALPRCRVIH